MMSYRVGAARIEITPDALGVEMLGWADPEHTVRGTATPLYARAISISVPEENKKLVMVCLDVCFITEALRLEVMARTGFRDDEIIISATHTHSAPGGYSSYVLYSLNNDGFISSIFETYVAGTVRAIEEASANLKPASIRFAEGDFPIREPVAFNRSIRAWNRNPDVTRYSRRQRNLAVDRQMTLLRFDRDDGTPIAAWNWFPVHATSMHRDNYKIHSDNKGMAANEMEEAFEHEGKSAFVAVFAQGAAGDVSPNYRWFVGLREKRGSFRRDDRSCKLNAHLQMKHAMKLFKKAGENPALPVKLASFFEYEDLSSVSIDPDFVGGEAGLETGPAEVGTPQLYGTAEGRGASYLMIFVMKIAIRICQLYNFFVDWYHDREPYWPWTNHPIQGRKITIIAPGRSEILETGRIDELIFPDFLHPTIATLRKWAKRGVLKQRPFSPQVLPIQLAQIGDLMITAVPAEFTTVAGWRLRKTIEQEFVGQGISRAIVQGYANAYASYVTTPEEYDQQSYEGGCTHFGKWTLPGYLTLFRGLCRKMISGKPASPLRPKLPSIQYMQAIEKK